MADITDKVAKLLAMAERTENPHEAEAFTEKAEELMLQYGIEMAQIAARGPVGNNVDPVIIEKIYINGTYEAATVTYGYAVAPSFNCRSFQSKGPQDKGHYIWIVGHTSDVEQAATLVRSLLIQSEFAMNYWWSAEGRASVLSWGGGRSEQKLARRQFMFAFGSGVRERLSEVRNRVVKEATVGTDLVLRDRGKRVDDWVGGNMSFRKTSGRSMKGGAAEAASAGHQAGRESVGNKSLH